MGGAGCCSHRCVLEVYQTIQNLYSSPPTPPFFIIRTEVFFEFPVPNIDWPPFQNIPWALGPGSGSPPPGFQVGNNVLQINLLHFGSVVLTANLVVTGVFGTVFDPASVGTSLAAALNAQLAGLSISPVDLYFATGPAAVPWNHTGLDVDLNDGDIVLATQRTGSRMGGCSVTGNMVSNLIHSEHLTHRC